MSETSEQSAIAKLKAKAAALSSLVGFGEQHVALASAGVFIHAGMNAEWDPKDHPRDPNNGEFVEQGKGVFLFGKSKTAEFSMSNGQKKPVELKPGSAAYKSAAGNVVVAHADGTFTLHDETGNSVQLPEDSKTVTDLKSNKLAKLGENPGVKVNAEDQAEAADKIAHPAKYDPDDTTTPTLPSAKKQAALDKDATLPNSIEFAGKTFDLKPGEKAYTSANNGSLVTISPEGEITYYDSSGNPWDANGQWDQAKFKAWFDGYGDDGGAYYTKQAEGTADTTTAPKGSPEEQEAKAQQIADEVVSEEQVADEEQEPQKPAPTHTAKKTAAKPPTPAEKPEESAPEAPMPSGWKTAEKGHEQFWNEVDQRYSADGVDLRVHHGTDLDDAQIKSFMGDLDTVLGKADLPFSVRVKVRPPKAYKGSHSATATVSKDMEGNNVYVLDISSNALKSAVGVEGHQSGGLMPAYNANQLQYLLAHEVGHLMDEHNQHNKKEGDTSVAAQAGKFWKENKDSLSSYGKSDKYEGYAEAFAEHLMGDGSNPVASAFAEKYGWSGGGSKESFDNTSAGTGAPDKPEEKIDAEKAAAPIPSKPAEGGKAAFKHPVSGATFPVNPGDKVYQHKASPDSFIIAGEGEPVFFNKNGKQQKVPSHTLKKLDTNYNEVSDSYPGSDGTASATEEPAPPPEKTTATAMENLKAKVSPAVKKAAAPPTTAKTPEAALADGEKLFSMPSYKPGQKFHYKQTADGEVISWNEDEGKFSDGPVAPNKKLQVLNSGVLVADKSAPAAEAPAKGNAEFPPGTKFDLHGSVFEVNDEGNWSYQGHPSDKATAVNLNEMAKADGVMGEEDDEEEEAPAAPAPVELKGKIKAMKEGDTLYATFKTTGKQSAYVKKADGTFAALNAEGVPTGNSGSEDALLKAAFGTQGEKFAFSFKPPKKADPTSPFVSGSGDEFVHPTEGVIGLHLTPGAVIKQHKAVPESFLVVHPDGHIDKVNKNGAIQKPGTALKVMDTNYADVYTVPEPYQHTEDDDADEPEAPKAAEAPTFGTVPVGTKITLGSKSYNKVSGGWVLDSHPDMKPLTGSVANTLEKHAQESSASESDEDEGAKPATLPQTGEKISTDHLPLLKTGDQITIHKTHGVKEAVYTKQVDGTWTSPDLGGVLSDTNVEYFIDKTTSHFTLGNDKGKSDDQTSTPEPVKKKAPAKKTAAKKTTAKTAEDFTFTLPGGEEVQLKPGEVLVETQIYKNGTYQTAYIQATNSGPNKAWDANGLSISAGPYWSKTAVKKHAKDNGGSVLGEYKVSQTKIDADAYTPLPISEESWDGANTALDQAKKLLSTSDAVPLAHSWWSGWTVNNYSEIEGDDAEPVSWSTLSTAQRVARVALLREPAGIAAASLAQIGKWPAGVLEKSDKAKFSKEKNRFAAVERIAVLAANLVDDDTDWDENKFEEEMAFLSAKADKPGTSFGKEFPFPVEEIHSTLATFNTQRKFKATLTGLDFDPYNASPEEYDKYAKEQGQQHLSGLTEDQQKLWVLGALGDPTVDNYTKNNIDKALKTAKNKAAVAELAAVLAAQKKEEQKYLPEKKSPVEGLGITGFAKSGFAQTYKWHNYITDTDVTATKVGHDEWQLTSSAMGSPVTFTDAQMQQSLLDLENAGTEVTKEGSAYDGQTFAEAKEALETKYGVNLDTASSSELNSVIKGEGGNYVGKMSVEEKSDWLTWAVKGDYIGQYAVEHSAATKGTGVHKNASVHPGSWESPQGKAAYGALAGQLLGTDWGKKLLSQTPFESSDYQQAFTDLELVPAYPQYQNKHAADVPHTVIMSLVEEWRATHTKPQQIAAMKENGPSAQAEVYAKVETEKPAEVGDEAWSLVTNATADSDLSSLLGIYGKMPETEVDAILAGSTYAKNAGLMTPVLGGVPLNVKRMATWAAAAMGSYDSDATHQEVLAAVAAKVKGGDYLEAGTPVWLGPDGVKYPISPGAQVWKSNDSSFIITGPPNADGSATGGYDVTSYGISTASSYKVQALEQYGFEKVFTMPGEVSWEKAKSENPDFYLPYWETVADAEEGKETQFTSSLTGAQLTHMLKNSEELKQYPHLAQQYKTLPESVRQLIAGSLEEHEDGLLDMIEYKAKEGHYASAQSLPLFDPAKSYNKYVSLGQFDATHIANYWPQATKNEFVADFGLKDAGEIPAYIDSIFNPASSNTVSATSKILPPVNDLTLTKLPKKLGGAHTKYAWADQDGNEWMSKPFPSDPNGPMRIEIEDAANKIGRLLGFRQPVTGTKTLGGQYSYLQHIAPATGTLIHKGPKDLSLKQLTQAMEEHVNDWLVSNHDTHPDNLMIDPDGNVFGIDKGQAFKFFPQDKLAHGYMPPGNGAPVWYDQFYSAVKNGSIDKETADAVTTGVLRKALKVSKAHDAEYRSLLEYALAKKTSWPTEYPSREAFIDGLLERKHDAFEDFVEFYKGIYAASPYSFDIDPENLASAKLDDHTHIAVSQELADEVKVSGTHGKALFFASPDLEDAHVLLSKVTSTEGKDMLSGEAKIRKDADLILHNWLKQQTIEKAVTPQAQSYAPPAKSHTSLPMADQWYSTIVNGAKTVSSHAQDGEYNANTLASMQTTKDQITSVLEDLKEWEEKNPVKPFKGKISGYEIELVTAEQQAAWKHAMEQMLANIAQVETHKAEGTKVSPHFTAYVYQKTGNVTNVSGEPKMISHWKNDLTGAKFAKWDDGGYTVEQSGTLYKSTEEKYLAVVVQGGEPVKEIPLEGDALAADEDVYMAPDGSSFQKTTSGKWVEYTEEGPAPEDTALTEKEMKEKYPDFGGPADGTEEVSADVQVGTKVLKVTYKKAHSKGGEFDQKTGELTMDGQEHTYLNPGQMYEIDFGNTVIEYRPWEGAGVPKSQRGLLRFYKKDWSGDAESIDEVLDTLRHMGVNLSPADETSMELFYWEHQMALLKDRKDKNSSKWQKTINHFDTEFAANPEMTPAEKMEALKAAWALSIGQDKVDDADWMPQFSRYKVQAHNDNPSATQGHPNWLRPDVSISDMRKFWSKGALPMSAIGTPYDLPKLLASGGLFSTEERMRLLGKPLGGASSDSDQEKGSSAHLFTRQNRHPGEALSLGSWEGSVLLHPRTAMRTTTYAFDSDNYGAADSKKHSSSWDLAVASKHGESSNEMMVKNGISILDDIMAVKFPNAAVRDEAIKDFKERGITHLHGFPIEEVFVTTTSQLKAVTPKLWNAIEQADAAKKEGAAA